MPSTCLQVLYTMPSWASSDADAAIISESGAMNVFFVLDKVCVYFRHLCKDEAILVQGLLVPGQRYLSILSWGTFYGHTLL